MKRSPRLLLAGAILLVTAACAGGDDASQDEADTSTSAPDASFDIIVIDPSSPTTTEIGSPIEDPTDPSTAGSTQPDPSDASTIPSLPDSPPEGPVQPLPRDEFGSAFEWGEKVWGTFVPLTPDPESGIEDNPDTSLIAAELANPANSDLTPSDFEAARNLAIELALEELTLGRFVNPQVLAAFPTWHPSVPDTVHVRVVYSFDRHANGGPGWVESYSEWLVRADGGGWQRRSLAP
jgi:hypothetical protein